MSLYKKTLSEILLTNVVLKLDIDIPEIYVGRRRYGICCLVMFYCGIYMAEHHETARRFQS